MFDVLEALTAYLKTQSSVTDDVGVANIAGRVPVGYNGAKFVLIIMDGGMFGEGPLQKPRVQIRCYAPATNSAPAARNARLLWAKVHDVLHRVGPVQVAITGGSVTLAKSWCSMLPQEGSNVEPETGWTFCMGVYTQVWTDRLSA